MSRPIVESVSLLNETLTNCKTNLKDKGVEADTIKISDVDEKITEIQAGGGGGNTTFNCIKDVYNNDKPYAFKGSYYYDSYNTDGAKPFDVNIKFTVTEDDCCILTKTTVNKTLDISPVAGGFSIYHLDKGTTYTVTGTDVYMYAILIFQEDRSGNISKMDLIGYSES